MPNPNDKQYFIVRFKFAGKSEATAGSADFILPAGAKFHEIEAAAEEIIMTFFSKIFPDAVMAVMPPPESITIIPGRILLHEEDGNV